MGKRQTRRAISLKGLTYQRLKKFCDAEGLACSGYLEELINDALDRKGCPRETVLKPHNPHPRLPNHSAHFTF